MSWETYYSFPVAYKLWLIERISKEIQKSQEANSSKPPSKAPHHNDATMRSLAGMSPGHGRAAKLQRFT